MISHKIHCAKLHVIFSEETMSDTRNGDEISWIPGRHIMSMLGFLQIPKSQFSCTEWPSTYAGFLVAHWYFCFLADQWFTLTSDCYSFTLMRFAHTEILYVYHVDRTCFIMPIKVINILIWEISKVKQWRIQVFPEEGAPTYYLVKNFLKTAWKWKNSDPEGASLAPPRSANGISVNLNSTESVKSLRSGTTRFHENEDFLRLPVFKNVQLETAFYVDICLYLDP